MGAGGLDLITYPPVGPAARMELGTELQVIGVPIGLNPIHNGARSACGHREPSPGLPACHGGTCLPC